MSKEILLNPNQSGFRQSNSCVNQLHLLTHKVFEAFDCNLPFKVRSTFLDIPECLLDALFYKLKSMGISGELYNPPENYP